MGIDIRTPIGLMFVIVGALLAVYGFLSSPEIYARSLGVNINLSWGVVMFLFGVVMMFLGRRAVRPPRPLAQSRR